MSTRQNPDNLLLKLGFLGAGAFALCVWARRQRNDRAGLVESIASTPPKGVAGGVVDLPSTVPREALTLLESPGFAPVDRVLAAGGRARKRDTDWARDTVRKEGSRKSWDDMDNTERGDECIVRLHLLHMRLPGQERASENWTAAQKRAVKKRGYEQYKRALYRCVEKNLGTDALFEMKRRYGKATESEKDLGYCTLYAGGLPAWAIDEAKWLAAHGHPKETSALGTGRGIKRGLIRVRCATAWGLWDYDQANDLGLYRDPPKGR